MRWGSLRVLGHIFQTALGGHFISIFSCLFALSSALVGSVCGTGLAWIAVAATGNVLSIILEFGSKVTAVRSIQELSVK